jgi:hypothetical protein
MDQGMATATKKIRSQNQGNFHGEGSVDAIHSVFYKGGIQNESSTILGLEPILSAALNSLRPSKQTYMKGLPA